LSELHLCNGAAAAVLEEDMTDGLATLLAVCGPTLSRLVLDTFHTLDLVAVGQQCRYSILYIHSNLSITSIL
jgi:hypothetical protein